MHRLGSLFPRLIRIEHLERAASLAARGKRRRPDVAWFRFRQEAELRRIQAALVRGTWQPATSTPLWIRDPKPRVIARAPFADRVIHAAVIDLLWPAIARSLMPENFACRPGYGTHRAALALQRGMQRHRFVLHLDLMRYFPSVDLAILRRLLARLTRDARLLTVVDAILDAGVHLYGWSQVRGWMKLSPEWPPAGRGLPMGALTSQVFATHVYLGGFDHFVKRELKVPAYVRYVDDIFLFGDRSELLRWRSEVGAWLENERGARLKHPEAPVIWTGSPLHGLGRRITQHTIEPLAQARWRLAGKLGQALREGAPEAVLARIVAARTDLLLRS